MNRIWVGMASAGLVLAAGSAAAAEWSIEPYIGLRTDYSDNYLFVQGGHNPGWDVSLSPGFKATEQTETTSFTWTANLSAVHNDVIDPRNRVDANTTLGWQYKGERDTYGATLTYVRDLTLASELTNTGYLTSVVERNSYIFTPSYARQLTERWAAGISASAAFSRYAQTGDNGLDNYDSYGVSPTLSYALDPQTKVIGALGGSWYRATPIENRTDSYTATIGITHQYTERLKLGATVGYAHTHVQTDGLFQCIVALNVNGSTVDETFPNSNCPVALTNTGAADVTTNSPVYSANFTWDLSELTTLTGTAARAIVPSGLGSTLDSQSYGLGLGHKFTERLSGNLNASLTHSKFSGGLGVPSSEYRTILANLSWRMLEQLTVEGGYRFSQIGFAGPSPNLNQSLIYLALRYDFQRIAVSR
jgi:hypothetical protein